MGTALLSNFCFQRHLSFSIWNLFVKTTRESVHDAFSLQSAGTNHERTTWWHLWRCIGVVVVCFESLYSWRFVWPASWDVSCVSSYRTSREQPTDWQGEMLIQAGWDERNDRGAIQSVKCSRPFVNASLSFHQHWPSPGLSFTLDQNIRFIFIIALRVPINLTVFLPALERSFRQPVFLELWHSFCLLRSGTIQSRSLWSPYGHLEEYVNTTFKLYSRTSANFFSYRRAILLTRLKGSFHSLQLKSKNMTKS